MATNYIQEEVFGNKKKDKEKKDKGLVEGLFAKLAGDGDKEENKDKNYPPLSPRDNCRTFSSGQQESDFRRQQSHESQCSGLLSHFGFDNKSKNDNHDQRPSLYEQDQQRRRGSNDAHSSGHYTRPDLVYHLEQSDYARSDHMTSEPRYPRQQEDRPPQYGWATTNQWQPRGGTGPASSRYAYPAHNDHQSLRSYPPQYDRGDYY